MKVAILGANGQVGAEVCLILQNQPGIEVVPVCRNRLGSAYLRYEGVACRHGYPTDGIQSKNLFGDCPVIANFARGSGSLREMADINDRLIRNSMEYSPPNATVLYFSTVSVYGTPYPESRFRWKNSYAREKLRCEQLALRYGKQYGKKVYVLRLGHVCGELQGITRIIRQDIANDTVAIPAPDRCSNVVYVATIVDAILRAATATLDNPGIYDLLNVPQWTWRQVYEFEAGNTGHNFGIDYSLAKESRVKTSIIRRFVTSLANVLMNNPVRKEYAMQIISRLSVPLNKRIQALYFKQRAASEIADLNSFKITNDALKWREVGEHPLTSLTDTLELMRKPEYRIHPTNPAVRWPEDMQMAGDHGSG